MADARAFAPNVGALAARFHVFTPDRRGHGRTPDVDGPISYELMARDTIAFLETVVGGPAHLVGHSDGAPTALTAALLRPDLVRGLVLAAGVFHHSGWAPGAIDLPDDVVAWFTEYNGAVSPEGPDHFPALYAKLHRMQSEEPTFTEKDLAGYPGPTLVMVGDDEAVSLAHTCSLYEALPNAQLAVVPAASHAVMLERPEIVHRLVREFLDTGGAVNTLMPVRRAGSASVPATDT
jgi:pimeloyl-ACP methyl ester carboxylesterase